MPACATSKRRPSRGKAIPVTREQSYDDTRGKGGGHDKTNDESAVTSDGIKEMWYTMNERERCQKKVRRSLYAVGGESRGQGDVNHGGKYVERGGEHCRR